MTQFDHDARSKLETVLKLAELAGANFPRGTDVRIETCGCDPKASLTLPCYLLHKAIEAALAAASAPSTKTEERHDER